MSFILDALKKADQKRRQGEVPTLPGDSAPPPGGGRRRPRWPYLLILVLALNAGLLGWWLLHGREGEMPPQPAVQARGSADPSPGGIADRSLPPPVVPSDRILTEDTPQGLPGKAEKAPLPPPSRVAGEQQSPGVREAEATRSEEPSEIGRAEGPVAGEVMPEEALSPAPEPALPQTAVAPEEVGPTAEEERIYELNELPAGLRARVPEMEVTLHFHAPDPAARLVRINGVNLREGYRLGEEVRVEEITPEGVIFSIQGHLFRMPDPVQGW